jgi:hypothetical protein
MRYGGQVLLARTSIALTAEEHAQLVAAAAAQLAELAPQLRQPYAVDRMEQPWFRRHNVLDIQLLAARPTRRFYVAVSSEAPRMAVLTGRLEQLHVMAAADPPLCLDNEALAASYAAYANEWTCGHGLGEMQISSFAEVPWLPELTEAQRAHKEQLRARVGARIGPELRRRSAAGWSFRAWWVAARTLFERELLVPIDGAMIRTDVVHATELAVPLGASWEVIDGRLLPTS